MRLVASLFLAVLLAAWSVHATVLVRQNVATTSSATIPVTLASGTTGTTTLGSSATSATTTGAALPLVVAATNLKVVHGSASWQVQLRATAATGLVGGITPDSITLGINNGGVPQTIVLTSASTYPLTTGAVTLSSAGPDISITSLGVCLGTCALTLQVLLFPSGQTSPAFTYSYSLSVT